MRTAIAILLASCAIASAQQNTGLICYEINRVSGVDIPCVEGIFQTAAYYEARYNPATDAMAWPKWDVSGMPSPPSLATLKALNTDSNALAWVADKVGQPQTAEEVAWTNLITAVGGTLPVQEGDIMVLAANIKAQIAAKQSAKDTAVQAQEWATAFGLQDDINKLNEQGTEITALSGVLGPRKYLLK